MKITYRRTGGFAPIPVACALDSAEISTDDAQQLRMLVDNSGIMQAQSKTTPAARDVRLHTLHIDDNGVSKQVSYDDINIPKDMRPLIDFLQQRAKSIFDDDEEEELVES